MNKSVVADDSVWYREFYVWLVICLPLCAVAASFATLFIAIKHAPEMAVSDYSSIEAFAADQLARDHRAAELDLNGQLTFTKTAVTATVTAREIDSLPDQLTLRLTHSTTALFDQQVVLTGISGYYSGAIELPAGAYDIQLEDAARSWRLATRLEGRPESVTLTSLRPAASQ